MRIRDYPRNLEVLVNHHIEKFLDVGSKERLIDRARSLRLTLQKKENNWSFLIPREHPLTFKKNDGRLQVDVSCNLEGRGENIKKQNILLRVWCFDENICYREDIDHPKLKANLESIGWKRVILRFHFDLRSPEVKQPEPLYHFQVGGINPSDDENCWFPEQINVPRFPYPPMDVILLCEFVLMNFFPEDYEEIRKKPEWKSLVRKSQIFFQKNYFKTCWESFNPNHSSDTIMGNLVTDAGGL